MAIKSLSFNGEVIPSVFDKYKELWTLGNDFDTINSNNGNNIPSPLSYRIIQCSGQGKCSDGEFSYSFIVPKDIAYQYGNGKLSFYAHNGSADAHGVYNDIVIGGFDEDAPGDFDGPDIQMFS